MKIQDYLTLKDIGLCEFATKIGVTRNTMYRWISKNQKPRPVFIRKITEITDGLIMPNDFYDSSEKQ